MERPNTHQSLADELAEQIERGQDRQSAEWQATLAKARQTLTSSDILERALGVGDQIPRFELPDASRDIVRIEDLLERGLVVISFYRGAWCPYCNLELRALERELRSIEATGATLVAISPNRPDISSELVKELHLTFPVLSDHDNRVAKAFGIVFELTHEHDELYRSRGRDLREIHGGTERVELPVPATYVVASSGTIGFAHVDLDHRRRAEPSVVAQSVAVLSRSAS